MGFSAIPRLSPYSTRTRNDDNVLSDVDDNNNLATTPASAGATNSCDGSTEIERDESSDSGDDSKFVVKEISRYRKVWKKRGRIEYLTEWRH